MGIESPVTPGSFPLRFPPGVPHSDQWDGFILEVRQQPVAQTHLLHRRYGVGVAFHQPVAHLQLNFMRLCLEQKWEIRCLIVAPPSAQYRDTACQTLMEQLMIPSRS